MGGAVGTCMNPQCRANGKITRGLCIACYAACCSYVRREFTSWKELEAAGKCKPPYQNRRSNGRDANKWLIDFVTSEEKLPSRSKVRIRATI